MATVLGRPHVLKEVHIMATNKNTSKKNTTAEAILTVAETKALFVELGILPKYTDNSHYVGCGTRANVFSVNSLKTRYNVYCSTDIFELFDEAEFKGVEFTKDGNKVDKTRPNVIVCKTKAQLTALLSKVLEYHQEFALAK